MWIGILDIAIVATLIYSLLAWFKRTKAAFVAMGMLMLALLYLFARAVGMTITVWLLQGFFAVAMVAIIVIFQEELRYAFERFAIWALRYGRQERATPEIIEVVKATVSKFAQQRTGALIVFRGRDPLHRHIASGWELDGALSQPLLDSIFDTHSLGHDGAALIENGRLARFGCHLPLAKDVSQHSPLGTRHTAALGLSERTDALCVVVSEETGGISISRAGTLVLVLDVASLQRQLEDFLAEIAPRPTKQTIQLVFTQNLREKGVALAVSTLIWLLLTGVGPT